MKFRTILAASLIVGTLGTLTAACTPAEQQALVNVSADLVKGGALFCSFATQSGPMTVALANAAGVPVSVTGQTATAVATACAIIGGIPVAPPVDAGSVPVVASGTTLPAATAVSPV